MPILGTHNVYKQWLVLTYLENPSDFPMASTCLQLSVTNHATAHTRNVGIHLTKPTKTRTNHI
ncbi:hypothetical protein ES711_02350 [Gelidibacter salicanalis]|uniref:Uncharacterized protein n=1 Tax=Gelidibacter salicanalis TaxID=291193 RepID=A0A5C7AQ87_9FLAO|nr:hypothetical protein ES711_02350 [Gelidibacter salicanalis]